MSSDAPALAMPDVSIGLEAQQSDLPVGWACAHLGEIVTQRNKKVQPDRSSPLPFIGMDDVPPGSLRATSHGWFRDMKSAANAVGPGDILYGRLRPYLNKVALADSSAAASGEFIILQPQAGVDARFVQFALHARRFVNFATRDTSGERPRIDFDKISKFRLPVPPPAEQRRIVARIDELFAEIAEGEAALKRARQGLDTWRRALLKAAVTGELTRDWREANRPAATGADLLARIRAQLGGLEAETIPARRPDMHEPPAFFEEPEGWEWTRIGDLTEVIDYGTSDKCTTDSVGVPVLRMGNIQDGNLDISRLKYADPTQVKNLPCSSG
jgi:type I restriction enzyme S subunit